MPALLGKAPHKQEGQEGTRAGNSPLLTCPAAANTPTAMHVEISTSSLLYLPTPMFPQRMNKRSTSSIRDELLYSC
jgi:hypothetical protein